MDTNISMRHRRPSSGSIVIFQCDTGVHASGSIKGNPSPTRWSRLLTEDIGPSSSIEIIPLVKLDYVLSYGMDHWYAINCCEDLIYHVIKNNVHCASLTNFITINQKYNTNQIAKKQKSRKLIWRVGLICTASTNIVTIWFWIFGLGRKWSWLPSFLCIHEVHWAFFVHAYLACTRPTIMDVHTLVFTTNIIGIIYEKHLICPGKAGNPKRVLSRFVAGSAPRW